MSDLFANETDATTDTAEETPSRGLQIVLVDEETETEKPPTITAEQAAECIVVAAQSWANAQDALTQADVSFRQSALAVVRASEGKVSDKAIADAVKKIKDNNPAIKGLSSDLYSSPTSVGYHRRTGLVLSLDGSLPEGVTGREVQTTIKGLSTKIADSIIGAAEDQCSAWEALSLALAQAKAAKAAADAKAEEEADDDGEKNETVKDAARYLKAALATITKASECDDDLWNDEAVKIASTIADMLTSRMAVLPGTTRGHLAVV